MDTELIFRIILSAIVIAIFVIRGYYQRRFFVERNKATLLESKLNMTVHTINEVIKIITLLVYLVAPHRMAWSALPLPDWLRWVGAGMGILSIPLLLWVHLALGRNFSPTLHLREGHTLVTTGPYRWVRHPMYSVFYMMMTSFFLLSANWFIGLLFIGGVTAVLISRVGREEATMIEQFGDEYRAYLQCTGRFLPRLTR